MSSSSIAEHLRQRAEPARIDISLSYPEMATAPRFSTTMEERLQQLDDEARIRASEAYKSEILIHVYHGDYQTYYEDGVKKRGRRFHLLGPRSNYEMNVGEPWTWHIYGVRQFGIDNDKAIQAQKDRDEIDRCLSIGEMPPASLLQRHRECMLHIQKALVTDEEAHWATGSSSASSAAADGAGAGAAAAAAAAAPPASSDA
jgi:hypothetical protein